MQLKLAICRKEGTTNYGSNGASAEISIELDPDFSIEMIGQVSALWHQALTAAVDSQLARMRTVPPAPPATDNPNRNTSPAGSGMTRTDGLHRPHRGRSIRTCCGTTADPGVVPGRRRTVGSYWGSPGGASGQGAARPRRRMALARACRGLVARGCRGSLRHAFRDRRERFRQRQRKRTELLT